MSNLLKNGWNLIGMMIALPMVNLFYKGPKMKFTRPLLSRRGLLLSGLCLVSLALGACGEAPMSDVHHIDRSSNIGTRGDEAISHPPVVLEKERGIPEGYPDLLGEESATFNVLHGVKSFRLTAESISFFHDSEEDMFELKVDNPSEDVAMRLRLSSLDPSQQIGEGKFPDPMFELNIGPSVWSNRSEDHCTPLVELGIDGKSPYALWGRFKGTLCEGDSEREFAGTFASLKPGVRASN